MNIGEKMAEIQKIRYSHDAMIDLLVNNPWISQNQLAAHFGYTAGWVSTIISSDAFQAKLEARREEIVDPLLKVSVEERFKAVVLRAYEVLQEKMALPSNLVNDDIALRAAEMGAKVIAANAKNSPPVRQPGDRLTELAARLNALQRPNTFDIPSGGDVVVTLQPQESSQ